MTELEEANVGFAQAWKFFVDRLPEGLYEEAEGWVAALGNVPVPFFNVFFLTSPAESREDLERRIAAVHERGSRLTHPWFLGLCEEWTPEGRNHACLTRGLTPAIPLFAMATDRVAQPRRTLPRLTYRRVKDRETAGLIARINASAYGMPPEAAASFAAPTLWDDSTFAYLGYRGGTAVTGAATIVVEDLLYVAFVATLPEEQRKGYAEAVMRQSLEEAGKATGLSRTLLHATQAGRPVYEAMGYRETAVFTLYTPTAGR